MLRLCEFEYWQQATGTDDRIEGTLIEVGAHLSKVAELLTVDIRTRDLAANATVTLMIVQILQIRFDAAPIRASELYLKRQLLLVAEVDELDDCTDAIVDGAARTLMRRLIL